MDGFSRDVRLALRALRRAPGYAAAVVATVAVGIAGNTAVFATIDAVLLRPDPIERPADLMVAWQHDPARNQPAIEITYRQFEAWARDTQVAAGMAAFSSSPWPMAWRRPGDPMRLAATAVTTSFFETLGAKPLLGRAFAPGDDTRQSGWVAILSHALWTTHFGGRASAVGMTLTLDDELFTIVGVMPAGFDFPRGADLWVPVVPVLANSSARWKVDALDATIRGHDNDAVVSGVTNMEAVLARELAPWRLTGSILALAAIFTFFLAVLGLVSQLGLDLAQRSRELAIRLAVGARPRHIHARVLARTAAAGAGGIAAGLAGAAAATRLLTSMLFEVSARDVATWAAVIALVVAALCCASFAVARRMTATDPATLLRAE